MHGVGEVFSLNEIIRESLARKVTHKEGGEWITHASIRGKNILGRDLNSSECPVSFRTVRRLSLRWLIHRVLETKQTIYTCLKFKYGSFKLQLGVVSVEATPEDTQLGEISGGDRLSDCILQTGEMTDDQQRTLRNRKEENLAGLISWKPNEWGIVGLIGMISSTTYTVFTTGQSLFCAFYIH